MRGLLLLLLAAVICWTWTYRGSFASSKKRLRSLLKGGMVVDPSQGKGKGKGKKYVIAAIVIMVIVAGSYILYNYLEGAGSGSGSGSGSDKTKAAKAKAAAKAARDKAARDKAALGDAAAGECKDDPEGLFSSGITCDSLSLKGGGTVKAKVNSDSGFCETHDMGEHGIDGKLLSEVCPRMCGKCT